MTNRRTNHRATPAATPAVIEVPAPPASPRPDASNPDRPRGWDELDFFQGVRAQCNELLEGIKLLDDSVLEGVEVGAWCLNDEALAVGLCINLLQLRKDLIRLRSASNVSDETPSH